MRRNVKLFCIVSGLMACVAMQVRADEATKWKATKFPGFSLGDVVIAKLIEKDGAEKKISILLNGFDRQNKVRIVVENTMRTEKRLRIVLVDGKKEEQEYEVKIPVRARRYDVKHLLTAQDSRRYDFRLDEIKVWDVQGNLLDTVAVSERLKRARHVFLVDRPKDTDQFRVDPFYASVLRGDVLFISADVPAPELAKTTLPNLNVRRFDAPRALRLAIPQVQLVKIGRASCRVRV